MSGDRKALIIACDEYEHEGLERLQAPAADAAALLRVLSDPDIADFTVHVVQNEPAHVVQLHIEDFLSDGHPDDVLLMHFSCHGLKSQSGQLFFAARDTRLDRLKSTAISADFVRQCLQASRSRSVVLLLDCCYGGAFSRGVTVRAGGDVDVLDSVSSRNLTGGRGRAVITASSAMEFSFEGERLAGDQRPRPSVFTQALVDALATGDADRDEDGWISLDELYDYIFEKVQEKNPNQTPSRDVQMQGDLFLARSRRERIRAAPLPPDLDAARKDQNMYTRRGAVIELRSRLLSEHLPTALGAYDALTELTNDIDYVADEARAALREATVRPAESQLDFEQVSQGAPSPHRIVRLLGPAIARDCTPLSSHAWLHVAKSSAGVDVSIDTTEQGLLRGRLVIKGLTGEAIVTVLADVVTPAVESPTNHAVTEFEPAQIPDAPHEPVTISRPKVSTVIPCPESPGPGRAMRFLSYMWALLPVLSLGILTPILAAIPTAHAAIRLHSRKLAWMSAAYGLSSLTLWILWIVAIEHRWTPVDGIFYIVLMAVSLLSTVHAFKLRRRVFVASFRPPRE